MMKPITEEMEIKLISSAIADIDDALSGLDVIKEGLGLRGQSTIEANLEAAKSRLKRILLLNLRQV
ncbi:MAG: hypothetical protein WC180_03065 [Candidatus Paceibacterota bacterium]